MCINNKSKTSLTLISDFLSTAKLFLKKILEIDTVNATSMFA